MRLTRLAVAGILLLCAGTMGLAAPAEAGYVAGGALLELKVDGKKKLKTIRMNWVWTPYFESTFSLGVFARCTLKDAAGDETGKNKIIFKNGRFSSINSTKFATLKKMSKKMKNGDTGYQSWNANFMKPLHADGPALASMDVQVKGKVPAGHTLFCTVDANEGVFGFTKAPLIHRGEPVLGPVGSGELVEE